MAKKALVSYIESSGNIPEGKRVLEVVEAGQEFEVHSNLKWLDCPDNVIGPNKYWYNPLTNSFKKLPEAIDPVEQAGMIAQDLTANPIVDLEKYVWDWDTETWSKVAK